MCGGSEDEGGKGGGEAGVLMVGVGGGGDVHVRRATCRGKPRHLNIFQVCHTLYT